MIDPKKLTTKNTPLNQVLKIYLATLDKDNFQKIEVSKSLYNYTKILYSSFGYDPKEYITIGKRLERDPYKRDKDLTIFLYTGGKDSLASYMKYKDLTKKRKLIFIKGLNPLYPKEYEMLAHHEKVLNEKIDIVEFKSPQLKGQVESSVKNLLTYLIALDYYQTIPKYMSFGFISYKEDDLLKELKEEGLDDDLLKSIERIQLEEDLEEGVQGSYQTSEVVGDGLPLIMESIIFLEKKYKVSMTKGLKTLHRTYLQVRRSKLKDYLTSCMSLTTFKEFNKKKTLEKYGIEVEGEYLLGGYIKTEQGKFPIEEVLPLKVSTKLYNFKNRRFEKVDKPTLNHICRKAYVGAYNCTVCFKCTEHYIVMKNKLHIPYSDSFIKSRYAILLKRVATMGNDNEVKLDRWLVDDLNVDQGLLEDLQKDRLITKKIRETIGEALEDVI